MQINSSKSLFQRPVLLGALIVLVLVITLATGVSHDQRYYLYEHWELLRTGQDPWALEIDGERIHPNAYGPLHTILGYSSFLHALAPKYILSLCALGIFAIILEEQKRNMTLSSFPIWFSPAVTFLLAPLVIIHTYIFGTNDIVPALSIAFAFRFRRRDQHGWMGVALGIGALIKFYPLLFVPFFALIGDGRIKLRGFFSASAVFLGGMITAYSVWGDSVLGPLLWSEERVPRMLSILRFLEPLSERVGGGGLVAFAVDHNSAIVVLTAALFGLYALLARLDWKIATLAGILAIFLVYKVGHTQFYLVWFVLFALMGAQSDQDDVRIYRRDFLPFAVFLSVFSILFYVSRFTNDGFYLDGRWYILRQVSSVLLWGSLLPCLWFVRRRLFKPIRFSFAVRW